MVEAEHIWLSVLKRLEWPDLPVFSWREISAWDNSIFEALLQTGVMVEIAPASTLECKECEESCFKEVVFHKYGESVHGFVYCERYGRIEVDLENLKRWVVRGDNLSQNVAEALNLSGEAEELLQGTWFLGYRHIGRRRRDFFFLRSASVDNTAQNSFSGCPFAIVLVPATLPAESYHPNNRFFPLTRFSRLSEAGIDIDIQGLEMALSARRLREPPQVASFSTPSGARWEQVAISFVSDEDVKINVKGVSGEVSFAEMGFKDRRKGNRPNKLWQILLLFANHNGQISWGDLKLREEEDTLKHNVSELRKCLKSYFGIDDDPFYPYKAERSYRTRFVIEDTRYGG